MKWSSSNATEVDEATFPGQNLLWNERTGGNEPSMDGIDRLLSARINEDRKRYFESMSLAQSVVLEIRKRNG
jgi:hypothetical protein